MITRIIILGALLALSVSYFLSGTNPPADHPYIQGRNKTVLVISNSEHGLANVHLATASALLENYPDIDIHYASFSSIRKRLEKISSFARARTPVARDIVFHEIEGVTFAEAIMEEGRNFILPPASAGMSSFADDFQLWISPWSAGDHMNIFHELSDIIDDVDPAVVVLDTWLRPAIDATRIKNRQHAFVTPNIVMDNFLGLQPLATRFWKFPA
jgi:Fe-S-cluster formation regulator IscX/YfhJ